MQTAKGVINFPFQNPIARRFILFHTKDSVSTELTNALRGLNIQCRGRSYAAPSDVPKPEKRGKRVSKDERKHMVEAYVNKYREANAGKFPSTTHAQKQVGGDYYAVRLILQELVYNFKLSPSEDIVKKPLIKESVKRNESVVEIVEIAKVSASPRTANEDLESKLPLVSSLEIENSLSKAKEEFQTNILVENTLSEDAVKSQTTATLDTTPTEGHLQVLETAEEGRKEEVSAKIVQDPVDLKQGHLQNQKSSEADNFAAWYALIGRQLRLNCYDKDSDTSTKQIKYEELHVKSSLWGNLKSLAEDLMNIWKKR